MRRTMPFMKKICREGIQEISLGVYDLRSVV